MKRSGSLRILLLLTVFFGLASCSDKYYDDEFLKNSDEKLCRHTWVEEYIESDTHERITHKLEFYRDHSGKEILERQRRIENVWGPVYKTDTYHMTWDWINNMEGLEIKIGGDYIYFDGVWVRENYLTGNFEGQEVTFRRFEK